MSFSYRKSFDFPSTSGTSNWSSTKSSVRGTKPKRKGSFNSRPKSGSNWCGAGSKKSASSKKYNGVNHVSWHSLDQIRDKEPNFYDMCLDKSINRLPSWVGAWNFTKSLGLLQITITPVRGFTDRYLDKVKASGKDVKYCFLGRGEPRFKYAMEIFYKSSGNKVVCFCSYNPYRGTFTSMGDLNIVVDIQKGNVFFSKNF